jgi:nucleotide-binding universal stress UspA family protein
VTVDESRTGPVVIGYDGSPPAQRTIRETAALLGPRSALVVVVWEPDVVYDALAPTFEPAPIDFRTVLEWEQALYEGAQRLAEEGASLAREHKLDAEGLAVADDLTVAATLLRIASEQDACALSLGSHGHRGLRELLLGSTTREVIRKAPCPVILVREPEPSSDKEDQDKKENQDEEDQDKEG